MKGECHGTLGRSVPERKKVFLKRPRIKEEWPFCHKAKGIVAGLSTNSTGM